MKLRLVRLGFLLSIVAAAMLIGPLTGRSTASAQDANTARAQDLFQQAQNKYVQGEFVEAAETFKAAYDARPFPKLLYNVGASYHMQGKKTSDVGAYGNAVEYYKRYLVEEPQAEDKAKIQKSITILEAEIERLRKDPPTSTTAAPSEEVAKLGDAKVRGLLVIESVPQGATVYIDGKEGGEFARTPWAGSLEGEHTYLIEKRGYKSVEGRIAPDPKLLLVLQVAMSEEDYLGWVEIRANIPGADVYVDDKSVGAIGKTPYSGNFKPGKHTFYVSADGYDEFTQELEVIAGEAHELGVQLKGSPVGYLNLRGAGIEKSEILVDGKVLCERGPCRKPIKEGTHTVTIRRPGYKPYTARVEVQARTEISVRAQLARKPGRGDAIAAGVVSAVFVGGGIYLGLQARDIERALRAEIDSGTPPIDSEDPRFFRGKVFAISANAAFAVSGLVALTAIYYTFRNKGSPSTGQIDVRAIAVEPQIGPGYAGLGMGVQW